MALGFLAFCGIAYIGASILTIAYDVLSADSKGRSYHDCSTEELREIMNDYVKADTETGYREAGKIRNIINERASKRARSNMIQA